MPDSAFDASKPHVSRVYDYLLGGKDSFAADRAVGDQMIASLPALQLGVRAQRDVLGRTLAQVRDAGRNVTTNQKRVQSARAARELQEKKLEAEEKKLAAGMSSVWSSR